MGLTLRLQGSGAVPGRRQAVEMTGGALTIGRADGNDLVLPDPERVISSRHCVVEARGGDYLLIDISTNGTFLNYSAEPVGPAPAPLNHGDVISVGRYELLVEIEATRRSRPDPMADLPPPLGEEPVAPPPRGLPQAGEDFLAALDDPGAGGRDFLDDLLGEGPKLGPSGPLIPEEPDLPGGDGLLPLDPFEDEAPAQGASVQDHSPAASDFFRPAAPRGPLIPDDWDSDLAAPAAPEPPPPPRAPPARRPPEPPPARPEPRPEPRPAAAPPRPAPSRAEPAPPPAAAPDGDALLRAFLRGAGLPDLPLPPAEAERAMEQAGETFRILVSGLREVLIARTSIKNEFRLDRTVISVDGNNPMKFSISAEQAVEAMIRLSMPGYLPAPKAAEEALDDVKAHEVAMVSGMQAAIQSLLKRFDPERLAGRIETGGLSALIGNRKARYWDAFESLYVDIAREAEDDFHALFGREFAKAYQAQVKKL